MRAPGIVALVAVVAAAVAVTAVASPKPPPPPTRPSGRMATWVWDEATVLADGPRRDLLAFARAKGVDALFVHAAPGYEGEAGFAALAALVQAASGQGASVTLVAGDPSWTLPAHHGDAVAFVERARRLEARLAARGLARSGRVLFDVEPYLLPAWRTSPQTVAADYAGLLRVLREAGRAASLEVWHTIPFWFPKYDAGGKSLDALALEASSGIVLMAYRNRAGDVESLAAPVLEQAAKLGRPVIVAVETMCIDPPRVSFCGQSAGELASALDHVALALRGSPAFAGLAVHKYASWASLPRR